MLWQFVVTHNPLDIYLDTGAEYRICVRAKIAVGGEIFQTVLK